MLYSQVTAGEEIVRDHVVPITKIRLYERRNNVRYQVFNCILILCEILFHFQTASLLGIQFTMNPELYAKFVMFVGHKLCKPTMSWEKLLIDRQRQIGNVSCTFWLFSTNLTKSHEIIYKFICL